MERDVADLRIEKSEDLENALNNILAELNPHFPNKPMI
jgi:hypothetical protein